MRKTPRLVVLQDIIAENYPEVEERVKRQHVTYTWDRHLVFRMTRMVDRHIIEPLRFGYFEDESVLVQLFPPLEGKIVAQDGPRIDVYWGPKPLCLYMDPEEWVSGLDRTDFPPRPALQGYLWFRFEEGDDEDYAFRLLTQALNNAKFCIKSRRVMQPLEQMETGESDESGAPPSGAPAYSSRP
ncbi:MAG TPA: hypothetical protein VI893_01535 [Thermoplasmata archaeon]|nr:hypothetical protein [Thermoplasmata archaeon]